MHWHPCLEKKIQYNNNGEKKKDKKKRVSRFFQQSHSTVWKVTFIFAKREEREDSPVALRITAPSAPSRNACEHSCPAALWGCRARGSTHTGAGAQDTAHRECHTQNTAHTRSATLRTPHTPGVPHSGHRAHRECHTQDTLGLPRCAGPGLRPGQCGQNLPFTQCCLALAMPAGEAGHCAHAAHHRAW